MTGARILPRDAGRWLEASAGWRNDYRVVRQACAYGWDMPDGYGARIHRYKNTEGKERGTPSYEDIEKIVTEATAYLESRTPSGFHFQWQEGNLDLLPCAEIDGHILRECNA